MKMYEVGGCVRDEILGVKSKDIDFTVVLEGNEGPFLGAAPFRKMTYELERMGFEIFVSSPEFLTVRAKFPKVNSITTMRFAGGGTREMDISGYGGMTADFVLARKEGEYTDGRRPDEVIPGTLEDDLARRDFTMNAIAKDSDGTLIDPFNGREDIDAGIIRAVGDPQERLTEDALRALRAVRFAVTKGFEIEESLADAIEDKFTWYALINFISDERIQVELSKMFRFDTPASLEVLGRFPSLTNAVFSGSVSLDATMKLKGRGQ
jgi:hypothetical protein